MICGVSLHRMSHQFSDHVHLPWYDTFVLHFRNAATIIDLSAVTIMQLDISFWRDMMNWFLHLAIRVRKLSLMFPCDWKIKGYVCFDGMHKTKVALQCSAIIPWKMDTSCYATFCYLHHAKRIIFQAEFNCTKSMGSYSMQWQHEILLNLFNNDVTFVSNVHSVHNKLQSSRSSF